VRGEAEQDAASDAGEYKVDDLPEVATLVIAIEQRLQQLLCTCRDRFGQSQCQRFRKVG
jgi:hypothetical protein